VAPQLLSWATHQSLPIQICLALLLILLTSAIVAITVWLWKLKAQAQLEDEEAALAVEDERFQQRIAPVADEVEKAVGIGHAISDAVEGARTEAREQALAILEQGVQIEERIGEVAKVATTKYRIARVADLDATAGFNMGRPSAATFPYVMDFVKDAFDTAQSSLEAIRDGTSDTLGIFVVGKADAGNTRLALKAVQESLSEWTALVWSNVYQSTADLPAPSLSAGRDLVLILDDLQNYAPGAAGSSHTALVGPGSLLHTLLGSLRQTQSESGGHLAVVATCRSEDISAVRTSFGWLLTELTSVSLPDFSSNPEDPTAAQIIDQFKSHGDVFPGDWNGRIGSLILGIDVMREQYEALDRSSSPAVPVLCAMKLMARSGIPEHTTRRIRAICAEILGEVAIRDDLKVWGRALDDLETREFVRREPATESGDDALVIQRDSYFDEVVTRYTDSDRFLPDDRDALLPLLSRLGDAIGLVFLGNAHYLADRFESALASYEASFRIDRTARTRALTGFALCGLSRFREAQSSHDESSHIGGIDHETSQHGLDIEVPLIRASDLNRAAFRLGDDASALFPYIVEPVAAEFAEAKAALRATATRQTPKLGILVLGKVTKVHPVQIGVSTFAGPPRGVKDFCTLT
jgi:tetratricopeptide (TPR) repeat protein